MLKPLPCIFHVVEVDFIHMFLNKISEDKTNELAENGCIKKIYFLAISHNIPTRYKVGDLLGRN